MIDTLAVKMSGIAFGEPFKNWLLGEYPDARFAQASYAPGQSWDACSIKDKKLGVLGIRSSRAGNILTAERSIGKYLNDDNAALLTAQEAVEGASAWLSDVVVRFAGWWELSDPLASAQVRRIDLCYQKAYESSSEIFPYIRAALNARRTTLFECLAPGRDGSKGVLDLPALQVHMSGVNYNKNRWEHARWYDKGIESGNEMFLNVVRHEEEIKGGYAGYVAQIVDGRLCCDREKARDRMNERYQGWGQGEVYDFGKLLSEHGKTGAAAIGMVLQPEYETLYKQHLSKQMFYRIRAVAMEARKLLIPVNLRLPEDAWLDSEVL